MPEMGDRVKHQVQLPVPWDHAIKGFGFASICAKSMTGIHVLTFVGTPNDVLIHRPSLSLRMLHDCALFNVRFIYQQIHHPYTSKDIYTPSL